MKVDPTIYPIIWFRDRNVDKSLVLTPPYQRKPSWTDDQKAHLIDTIIKKYYLSMIYIHRYLDSAGKDIYNVIDGRQRIRSILEFINGDFGLSEKYNPEYAHYKFKDLPETTKKDLRNYPICVNELTNATEKDVRSVLKMISKNDVRLNRQELKKVRDQLQRLKGKSSWNLSK